MNRSPSITERRPGRGRSAPRANGGSGGSRAAAYRATVNSSASVAYATGKPPHFAMITPASSGPATVPTFVTVKFSVLAAGTSERSSSRGRIALRVGEVTANAADWIPTSTMISTRLSSPSSAWASSPRVTTQVAVAEISSSLRRSTASATAPPHSPNTISGTSPTRPSTPTQNDDRVRSYTWTGTATAVTWNPTNETPCPTNSRR